MEIRMPPRLMLCGSLDGIQYTILVPSGKDMTMRCMVERLDLAVESWSASIGRAQPDAVHGPSMAIRAAVMVACRSLCMRDLGQLAALFANTERHHLMRPGVRRGSPHRK